VKVFLTGGGGFIGGALDTRLTAAGHDVTALVHSQQVQRSGPIVRGDLADTSGFRYALNGQDAVVHLAARAHVLREDNGDPLAAFRAINRDASLELARASAAAGIRHFVFISSIGVNGNDSGSGRFDEQSPARPHQAYAISKHEAELGLLALAQAGTIALTIIRPTLVYGPRAPGNMRRLLRLVQRSLPLPLASATAGKSFISVENLADLIAACLDRPPEVSALFLAADDQTVSTAALIRTMGSAMGRRPLLFPAPAVAVSMAKRFGPTRGIATQLFTPLTVDNRRAKAVLDWRPRLTTLDGIAEMAVRYAQAPW
jgi:nucleoside-diphosphate-sugar epimerase